MARRTAQNNNNAAGRNAIRGPHSALTDFLAAHNISAAQIRDDYEARRNQQDQQTDANASDQTANGQEEDDEEDDDDALTPAQLRKRKRETEAALEKIKKSKAFKKRKKYMEGEPGADDDDGLAFDLYERARPAPGQLEYCDICEKRFTVTPYSKEGPDGGLLCTKCSKEMKDDEKKAVRKAAAAKAGPKKRIARRQIQSQLLDGTSRHGSKSLVDLCVEKVADHSNDIEEFGDIGYHDKLIKKLSHIFSKRRVLDSRTSKLFLGPEYTNVTLHDCGSMETSDFNYVFAVVPKVEKLTLRNAGQMKDETIDYILAKNVRIQHMDLDACNLITDPKWCEFFEKAGVQLKTLKLSWLDFAMVDDTVAALVKHCPNLSCLKLKHCFKMSEISLAQIATLQRLEHLSLSMMNPVSEEIVNDLVSSVGDKLKTLSFERIDSISDTTFKIIHDQCRKLKKLRISNNDYAQDDAYEALFTSWANPGLDFIDFDSSRDAESHNPEDREDEYAGLGDKGFQALMQHSGLKLKKLNIASCRQITRSALADIFDGKKSYPSLEEIDLSLMPDVDDIVVRGVFQSCPKIKKVTVFACFGVKGVEVPKGVALIGTPHAHEAIVQEGTTLRDD